MSISRIETIFWFTTPKELRRIADKMVADMESKVAGESCTTSTIVGDGTEIRISADQSAFHRHKTTSSDWI